MPRIVQTPSATSKSGAKQPKSPASAAVASLLSRGLIASEDMSPQDRSQQRQTLKDMTEALDEAGFSVASSKNGLSTFAHKDGTTIAVTTTATSLKVAYAVGKRKLDVADLARDIPFAKPADKSAAAKLLAAAQAASSKKPVELDVADLKKAGFPHDPSASTTTHPDGSWAIDTGNGFVVGFGENRVWPPVAGDPAPTAPTAPAPASTSNNGAPATTATAQTTATAKATATAKTTATAQTTTTAQAAAVGKTDTLEKPKTIVDDKASEASKPRKAEAPPSLEPSKWKDAKPFKAEDAGLDAVIFLCDSRGVRTETIRKRLEKVAREVPATSTDGWKQEAWRFADGSQLVLAQANNSKELQAFLMRPDPNGGPINVDLNYADVFHYPLTTESGPAAATLDADLLRSPDAAAELKKRGFKKTSDRLFFHQDGSWAVIVPSGAKDGAARVGAGVGERRYALDDKIVDRENAFADLPPQIRQMVQLSPPGQDVDLQLFSKQLLALDPQMLNALANAGYTLKVTRYRLSNADADLKNETITGGGAGPAMFDLAEGVHSSGGGKKPHITVRTYLVDGQLRIDASTLIHEIGHAMDLVIGPTVGTSQNAVNVRSQQQRGAGGGPRDPCHVEKDLVDAFTDEHKRLPQYFHTQTEFAAETFAIFMLDPIRCRRMFPKAHDAWEKRFSNIKPDAAKLFALETHYDRAAVAAVAAGPDIRKQLAFSAQQNRVLRAAGAPTQPIIAFVEGKADWGMDAMALDASQQVRKSFGKEAGIHRSTENFIKLTVGQATSAKDIEDILTDIETTGRPATLYVNDASQLKPDSAIFTVYQSFIERHRDTPPLIIGGEATALASLNGALLGAVVIKSKLEALGPQHQATLVARMAEQEGFFFAKGALPLLESKLKGGGYQIAAETWRAVKKAQFERQLAAADLNPDGTARSDKKNDATIVPDEAITQAQMAEVREITVGDVEGMKVAAKKTPQERLAEMIGQDEAKRQIDALVNQAKVSAMRAAAELVDPTPARMNLLFSGAPGTGKTTFAEILGALLQDIGFIKNPTVTKVTIQDLITGSPEAAIKALFEKNKGGVIFLDEMHQLKDTQEGRRAFRAMIPYLADPAYQDTVFIGAGYNDELGQLLRDVDAGAERRFSTVPFLDYKKGELATILDTKAKSQNLIMTPEAREAALAFLDYRKRVVKNFGNAGEIDIALGHAQKAQTLRVAEMPTDKITKRVLMELTPEDFKVPTPITKDEFWKQMDAMSGWDDVKAQLHTMAASIEGAVRRGKQPTDAVEPYWIIDGPPGTGKSTLARMLSMFGAAYGLTALPDVIDLQGANFQGEYVGQTAGIVQKQFEKAWGRLMFVDEVSGLAKSGGDFKFEAAKMILAQTENHRGKFMMVVADYAENINQFLGLDPGLARRFGNRITLKPWTPEQATSDLIKKLAEDGVVMLGFEPVAKKLFTELAKLPGYASGGDVRTLKGAIMALIDAFPDEDMTKLLPKALDQAFELLFEKKKKDAAPAAKNPESSAAVATASAVASTEAEKPADIVIDSHDEKVFAALDATNVKLAKQMNNLSQAEIERLESDPKSFFAKELAKQLGVKPEEALKQLTRVKVKVKKMVEVKKQELQQRFQYLCPFCGGLESPSCAYINYPLDWKIQHSRKKPWTEVKETITQQEVEVIEEKDV